MFTQRSALRLAQRAAPARSAAQRRLNSTQSKYPWIVDNEFNRERAAVKHHAASTSGTFAHSGPLRLCIHSFFVSKQKGTDQLFF
jgi:hypothetical protein